MSNQKSIGQGFAILSMAGVLVKIISLLYVPILNKILGEVGYGVYGKTYTVFSFIYIIANSGIPVAISKFVSELSEKRYHFAALRTLKIARSLLIVIGLVLSVIMAVSALIIRNSETWGRTWLGILVLSPCVLITAILSAYRGYFQGRQRMSPTAITQIIEQIFNFIFSIAFAAVLISKGGIEWGVAGGSIGTSVGAFAALIIIVIMFKRYRNDGYATPGDTIKSPYSYKDLVSTLIKYSVPITICSAIQFGGNFIDAINTSGRLIASGLPIDAADAQYGFLNKSQQLINVPVSFAIALAVAMLPAIASSIAVNDIRSATQKIQYSLRLCYIVSVPFAFGMAMLHGGIFKVLHFEPQGSPLLLFGSLTLILLATAQIQTSILQSLNRLYYVMFSLSIGVIIKFAINYFLIAMPSIRTYGAIIGTYVSMFIVVLINQYMIKKKEHIKINMIHIIWRPVAASIYMSAVVCILYYLPIRIRPSLADSYPVSLLLTVISAAAGVLVYFIIMAKLKGLRKKDIMSISGKIYRLIPGFMKRMLT